jgi:hypothetical protein
MAETNSTATKAPNYTDEMTASIVEQYSNGVDLDTIAESVSKTVRSVRSKLVREGVYVAKPKPVTAKREGPTKKELLRNLEDTGFNTVGFEGATKDALVRLLDLVH